MSDVAVRKFVEFIFDEEPHVSLEMRAPDSSYPRYMLTDDFAEKLSHVVTVKQAIICVKWALDLEDFFTRDQLIVHKTYFTYMIFFCLKEHQCQSNIFESFLAVCAGVEYFSRTTIKITELDYHDLNTDIVMEIYESVLKRTFIRRKGFQRLAEYISNHEYLEWDVTLISPAIHSDPMAEDMKDKLKKEAISQRQTRKSYKVDLEALRISAMDMAQKLLQKLSAKLAGFPRDLGTKNTATASSLSDSPKLHASTKSVRQKDIPTTSVEPHILPEDRDSKGTVTVSAKTKTQKVSSVTSVEPPILPTDRDSKGTVRASTKTKKKKVSSETSEELPTFSSNHDSNQMVNASKLTNAAKKVEKKKTTKGHVKFVPVGNSQDISSPCVNAHSETKRPETSESYENVLQAVIKHNQSKTAGPASSRNEEILKKVGEVVEYLRDTIKSLIDLMDNYDED